ncbi:MAG TPA: GtrA family protein [Patescibacteria group bacterium]
MKYALNGVLIALSQFVVIILLVELMAFNSGYLRNVANFISVIVGLLVAFMLHSKITWRYRFSSHQEMAYKLLMFYLVSVFSIFLRMFAFYVFDRAGMDYKLNVIIGIIIIIVINFFGYDRLVFKNMNLMAKEHVQK